MNWKVFIVFGCSLCLANSIPGYHPLLRGPSVGVYFTPPVIHRAPTHSRRTALETMVDLTNNLGVAILQDHSYFRSNFAFSPYGVASVLVVLYEGARGESARQIRTAVGFPSDKDIIRVGFRDIHRHLRSYFSHEGYLSGISLNKDSSSLKPEFKKILRFYGYDIDSNLPSEHDDASDEKTQSPTFEPTKTTVRSPVTQHTNTSYETNTEKTNNTTNPASDESEKTTTVQSVATEASTEQFENLSGHVTEEPNEITNFTLTSTPVFEEITQTTISSTESEDGSKTLSITEEPWEKNTASTSQEPSTTDDQLQLHPAVEKNYTSKSGANDTNEHQDEGMKNREEKEDENKSKQETTNSEMPTEVSETVSNSYDVSTWENNVPETGTQETASENEMSEFDNGMLIPQVGDAETTPTESFSMTTDGEEISSFMTDATTEYLGESIKNEENRKSPLHQNEISAEDKMKMGRNTIQVEEDLSKRIRSIINTKVPLWLGGNSKKTNARIRRTLTDYLKSPYSPDLSLQLQNGMYDTHISRNADLYKSLPRLLFLVDGAVDTPVPMMTYTNVFPYAYIPRLHAKALEFPLDDIRYKLLLLLPVERRGLRQLIYDLADFPLSRVLKAVEPTRVKAMVPTFMVEGFVILTSSLQKLGIWDVFDPRKANLSAMSLDPELYVRNVEQSVTVVIRNYVEILDIQTRTMAARQMEYLFEVTHPFLYFVLDTATNTALMAGQILDPLNSRIY